MRTTFSLLPVLALTMSVAFAQDQTAVLATGFDGFADVPNNPALIAPPAITVEAWITYDESSLPTGGALWPTVVRANVTPGQESYFLRVAANTTGVRSLVWKVNTTGSGGINVVWNFNPGQLVAWTHVAATYDGAVARLFVNGAQVGQTPGSGAIVNQGGLLRIGKGDPAGAIAGAEVWNGQIDEMRIWSSALTAAQIAAGMFQTPTPSAALQARWPMDGNVQDATGNGNHGTISGLFGFQPATRPLVPEFELNDPAASMRANGGTNTPLTPVETTTCVNQIFPIAVESTLVNLPWDVGVTIPEPGVPASMGGVVLVGGQVVNLDITAPSLTFLNGFLFVTPFPGSFTLPVSFSTVNDLSAQFVIVDPGQLVGASLSALNTIHTANVGSVLGPAVDDGFLQVTLAGPPLCGPNVIAFAGTTYTNLFVNSNGSVSFGAGITTFTPTVALFSSQAPRLAAMWTDLNPAAGGTIGTSAASGVVTVSFQNVPPFAGIGLSTFDMVFDPSGACFIQNYAPGAGHTGATLVGLSPGLLATDPGPVSFSGLVGMGPQANASTDMVYQFMTGGAVPGGFTSILFPSSNASSWIVN